MTKDELISLQALKIEELKKEIEFYENAKKHIHQIIYCIGGPLNDNKLGYSSAQLLNFKLIIDELF